MLGETYQCFWEDGTKMYLEHISHIPPIVTIYILKIIVKIYLL